MSFQSNLTGVFGFVLLFFCFFVKNVRGGVVLRRPCHGLQQYGVYHQRTVPYVAMWLTIVSCAWRALSVHTRDRFECITSSTVHRHPVRLSHRTCRDETRVAAAPRRTMVARQPLQRLVTGRRLNKAMCCWRSTASHAWTYPMTM